MQAGCHKRMDIVSGLGILLLAGALTTCVRAEDTVQFRIQIDKVDQRLTSALIKTENVAGELKRPQQPTKASQTKSELSAWRVEPVRVSARAIKMRRAATAY